MDRKRKYLGMAAVVLVALGAGQLVQTMADGQTPRPTTPENIVKTAAGPETMVPAATADLLLPTSPAAVPIDAAATVPPSNPVPEASDSAAVGPETTELAALTAEIPSLPPRDTLPAVDPSVATPPPAGTAAAPPCGPVLTLTAAPQAMISVVLSSPCQPGSRVVLRHAGMTVAETLDDKGILVLDLPALEARGQVSVLLPDAVTAEGAVEIPDIAQMRRFAVQWMADDTFQLTALENGAAYGEPGFVSAENPVSPNGGYLMSLGNPAETLPMLAQVYTWPGDGKTRAEPVIEAVVTDLTCGREMLGRTLLSDNGRISSKDLSLAMPDCTAVGDILVLNNLVDGTTLAAAN
ncbi:MAG: hypothetical protein IAE87_10175 [Rhodobacteraceae bacterium]|nr:hypothetical protein [Paracoccaceae bacterium]